MTDVELETYKLYCVYGGNSSTTSSIDASSATIKWNSNLIATGMVEYGETTSYGKTVTESNLSRWHNISLSGLTPLTTYHYRVKSINGNGTIEYYPDQMFTTLADSVISLGDTGNVTRMEMTGNFDAKNPDSSVNSAPRQEVAKEYIATHGDTYDFLVYLSTFDYALPEAGANGFYLGVKNDTQGINQPIFDNSAQFGSNGKLQGTIDLGNVTALAAAPYGAKLDETVTVLNHELMHRFGAYARYKNPDASLNSALVGKDAAHWSYLLDSKGSLMYGNGWKDNANGTFTSVSKESGFSPLDLYLMGMIPKEQVPPMMLIENATIDKTKLPNLGDTITGTNKTVTIDDIIAAEGARVPNSTTSQKKFNVGFVLLSRPGDNTTAATQAIEILRKAWAGKFAELTQGVGGIANVSASVSVVIDSPADNATITGPDVAVTGTVINTSGTETGVVVNGIPATISGSRFIVNHVPLQVGSNTISVTATDANALTSIATRNVTAQAGNYIRIVSNIDSGTAPLNPSIRLNASFSIANPTISTNGPVGLVLTQGASASEFTATLTVEGTYTITVSAVGPNGQTYTDSVTITVINRNQLENLLKAKWEGIKTKMAANDIEGAVSYLPTFSQAYYRELFTAMGSRLHVLAEDLPLPKLGSASDSIAKSLISRQETVLGQQKMVGYLINFIKENGIWKLQKL